MLDSVEGVQENCVVTSSWTEPIGTRAPFTGPLGRGHSAALAHIGGALSSPRTQQELGVEVLEILKRVVPYAAASLQAWDPIHKRHLTIANAGYPAHAIEHLDKWFVASDEAYRYMRDVDDRPVRWRDMPFDYRSLHSATEYWLPLGYEEGVTTCLFDGLGRYTGNLHLNVDSRRHPADSAMTILYILQNMLAGLVDVLRVPTWIAKTLGPDAAAGVMTPDGAIVPVPGCAQITSVFDDERLVAAVTDVVRRPEGPSAVLWRDRSQRWHCLQLHRLQHGKLLLDEEITALPYGVTARELDVLTFLASGASNFDIATELTVSAKTVAKHVEHLLEKLACRSRSGLAGRALSNGLIRIDT